MGNIGEMLRSGREKAGLEREELARIIRISPAAARALEEESWEALPPPVFVRGFVTSWCRAVGMDERLARDALARAVEDSGDVMDNLPRLPDSTGIVVGSRPSRSRRMDARFMRRASIVLLVGAAAVLAVIYSRC